MTDQLKQQFILKISQVNKSGMIVVLYEILLTYIEDAYQANNDNDKEAFVKAIKKAKNCNKELIDSLHFEYPIANMLLKLYVYINKELTMAYVYNDTSHLEIVKTIMLELHEAHEKVAHEDLSDPVMENIQTVYAGLTYGKKNLIENLSDLGTNRGFLV